MSLTSFYHGLLALSAVLAVSALLALLFVHAPYGRWASGRWGRSVPGGIGWVLMESPAALVMAACYALGHRTLVGTLLFGLWELHYVYRAFVYPFRRTSRARPMPIAVVVMGAAFNLMNAWLNGTWLFELTDGYDGSWLGDPRFIGGVVAFVAGLLLNRWADAILRSLRAPGETGYKIPYGGPYRFVSCPNYLGEIIMWCGWALATWSTPGLLFALWSIANLVPRARDYHRWYLEHFADYPPERRALLPGLW